MKFFFFKKKKFESLRYSEEKIIHNAQNNSQSLTIALILITNKFLRLHQTPNLV